MRKIGYGINSYHKTASIWIEYSSPLVFALKGTFDFICWYLVPPIPLPNFKITREGETYTIKEYYRNLGELFCLLVHHPILDFCYKRIESRTIDIDYDKAKEAFYDKDKKFWDENEKEAKEIEND